MIRKIRSLMSSQFSFPIKMRSLKYHHIINMNMKDQEQLVLQDTDCKNCRVKELSISKCTNLITLLKKKVACLQKSQVKSSQYLMLNKMKFHHKQEALKTKGLSLILKILDDNSIAFAFEKIFTHAISIQLQMMGITGQQEKQNKQASLNILEPRMPQILKSSASHGDFFPSLQTFKKSQLKYQFELALKNKRLQQRVKFLQQQVQDSMKRQERQVAKKRQSLSGLMEELSQKNEMIEDLKSSIRRLENKLGVRESSILESMLVQDSESLRKAIFRLQNINERLNIDLNRIKQEKIELQFSNKQMVSQIDGLRAQIRQLKEQNFDLQHKQLHLQASRKEIQLVSRKLVEKSSNIRKLQKNLNSNIRYKNDIKNGILQSTYESKLTKMKSIQSFDHTVHQDLQQKLESIFIYLFHIHDASFNLNHPQLFDEQQKGVLSAHKQKYLQKIHRQNSVVVEQKQEQEHEHFGDSVIEIFDGPYILKQTVEKPSLKISEIQQSNKLIQKISELKQRNLYVRNVLLSLLKSLQLRSIKKETQGILSMLSDYFEYSEQQRNQIFKPKNKKMFGFI